MASAHRGERVHEVAVFRWYETVVLEPERDAIGELEVGAPDDAEDGGLVGVGERPLVEEGEQEGPQPVSAP